MVYGGGNKQMEVRALREDGGAPAVTGSNPRQTSDKELDRVWKGVKELKSWEWTYGQTPEFTNTLSGHLGFGEIVCWVHTISSLNRLRDAADISTDRDHDCPSRSHTFHILFTGIAKSPTGSIGSATSRPPRTARCSRPLPHWEAIRNTPRTRDGRMWRDKRGARRSKGMAETEDVIHVPPSFQRKRVV